MERRKLRTRSLTEGAGLYAVALFDPLSRAWIRGYTFRWEWQVWGAICVDEY